MVVMTSRTVFQLRCSPDELGAWRVVAGDVPLGRWARRVLNEAAGSVSAVPAGSFGPFVAGERVEAIDEDGNRVVVSDTARAIRPYGAKEFKPDFGSRLKKEGK